MEQRSILQNETDLPAQCLQIVVAHVHAVDPHHAARRIVEPRDHAHYRRLAAAGGTDDAHGLPWGNAEHDVAEHLGLGVVAESDVVKGDFAAQRPGIPGTWLFRQDIVGIENQLYALDRHRCLGDAVAHLRQILHRFEKLAEIGEEDAVPRRPWRG